MKPFKFWDGKPIKPGPNDKVAVKGNKVIVTFPDGCEMEFPGYVTKDGDVMLTMMDAEEIMEFREPKEVEFHEPIEIIEEV